MGGFSGVDGQATGKSNVLGDRCAADESNDGARSAHPVLTGGESAPPPGHVSDGETAVSYQPAAMATTR